MNFERRKICRHAVINDESNRHSKDLNFKSVERMLFAFCCCCLLTSKSLRFSFFFSGGGCSDFLKADDIKAFKCYCMHFGFFFCGSCSEFFFSYKRTKSNNRKGWQVLLRSLAYSCWSCGLFSYRITFSTSGLLRSWKWIILAVFKWVFTWFPETVLRGAPPPGVPRRSTIDPLGCDRERKRKKER